VHAVQLRNGGPGRDLLAAGDKPAGHLVRDRGRDCRPSSSPCRLPSRT
jgi:hypothetical protein